MDPVVVIDFETTGLSPDNGDRATEIAALVRDGRFVDQYQSLMNSGWRIPPSPSSSSESAKSWCAKHHRPAESCPRSRTSSATMVERLADRHQFDPDQAFLHDGIRLDGVRLRTQLGRDAKRLSRSVVAVGLCCNATMKESRRCA